MNVCPDTTALQSVTRANMIPSKDITWRPGACHERVYYKDYNKIDSLQDSKN